MLLRTLCSVFLLSLVACGLARGQNDLPTPTASIQAVPVNSLIIGMDNTTQAVPGYFNLRAYGLINQLLQNNIPVKWAIRAGKAKDGVDFTCTAARIYPSFTAPTSYSFKAGPFIVDAANAGAALPIITAYGNNVAVYQLLQNLLVDIRYTLNFKPRPVVCSNGGNQTIHTNILTQAGIPAANYSVLPAGQAVPICGYSIASEPHWDALSDTAETYAICRYVRNGGNFFSQCRGVYIYENDDTSHTTAGIINTNATISSYAYLNADMPIMQFDGPLALASGSLKNWNTAFGSSFRSTTYTGVRAATGTPYQVLAGAKRVPNNLAGGNVFYMGGHDYGATNTNDLINGRRIYLNAVFIPPGPGIVCTVLPVELHFFEAKGLDDAVRLQWETGSEINNDYFLLERSRDGEDWEPVTRVAGNGTTTELHRYEFVDREPYRGVSYYRLTQYDYDGHSEAFPAVSAIVGWKPKPVSVFPNPVSDRHLFMQFPANSGTIHCIARGVQGELLLDLTIDAPGEEPFTHSIDLPDQFGPGVYTFHFITDQNEQTERVTVLK